MRVSLDEGSSQTRAQNFMFLCACVLLLRYKHCIHKQSEIQVVTLICNQAKAKWDPEPNQCSFTPLGEVFSTEKRCFIVLAGASRPLKEVVRCCERWRSFFYCFFFDFLLENGVFPKLRGRQTCKNLLHRRRRKYLRALPGGESALSPAEGSYSFRKSVASTDKDRYIPLSPAAEESLVHRRGEEKTLIPRWFVFLPPSHQPLRAGSPQ